MKIGVAATGESLDAEVSDQFGRCPCFVIVDSQTLSMESISNPGRDMSGGAGPAAVQQLVNHGAQVALAGNFGPKAEQALEAAGLRYAEVKGSVREAISPWQD